MVDTALVALTILAVLARFWWDRFRDVTNLFSRARVVRETAYGLSELRLPHGWRQATALNDGAGAEMIDPLRGRYALLFSEWREDFDAAFTLDQYSVNTREELTSSVQVLATHGPERCRVGVFDALKYEIEAVHDMTHIKYLHTSILGRRAFHQVVAWAPWRSYSRSEFEKLLDGFRETAGPAAAPRAHVTPVARRRIGF